MKTIYTLFPEMLNLNGDSANSMVLKKNLQWMGEPSQILPVSNETELIELSRLVKNGETGIFVTIGHGSAAAMQSLAPYDGHIQALLLQMVEAKTPGIVVGSALAWAGVDVSSKRERRSEFVVAHVDAEGWPTEALGYLNSDLSLEPIRVEGNLVLTLLHGPFLAKNPLWLDRIIEILGVETTTSELKICAERYVKEIWNLEANH